jgi:succinate dehydrogenase / fumarate reductase cytochrome b subunit
MELLNKSLPVPRYFWLKRLHSLAGLGLVLFIIFHLFTNSQTALWVGQYGISYIHSVNAIADIPYLLAVEIFVLGLPIFIHAFLGLKYLFTSEQNVFGNDGRHPHLPEYRRNRAYTWQRITSWILLFGIVFHLIHMRVIKHPVELQEGINHRYTVMISDDPGLKTVAEKLNVQILSKDSKSGQVMALTRDFGTAELLIVRDAFKSFTLMLIYTIFVLAACFHAFNGLWSFMITWGVSVTERSQRWVLRCATWLMAWVVFLGLASIYGTYWINLKQ